MNIGDKMPVFSVADQHGNIVTDQQLRGKRAGSEKELPFRQYRAT